MQPLIKFLNALIGFCFACLALTVFSLAAAAFLGLLAAAGAWTFIEVLNFLGI